MKQAVLFFCLIALATFLRFWHLGGVPISPNWDEAAIGYNAYSILKTGKDEYGTVFPLILRSFNNYTPALYAYLAIPGIALFDLSATSLRLPSAIMGVLAVIGTFFLTQEVLSLDKWNDKRKRYLSLLATFLLAISPWHIQFSRVAYEASVAFTLVVWGLVLFLMGLKRPVCFIASAILYGLSINAYHSPRLFVPLFVVGLAVIFRHTLIKNKKHLLVPIVVGSLFLLPFLYFFTQGENNQILARFSATSLFTQTSPDQEKEATIPSVSDAVFGLPIEQGFYQILTGYLTHFSPLWLFITGDNDRHHAPSMGLLYLWEAPFLLLGIFTLLLSRGKVKQVLLLWILLVPIPASLTSEVPHAVRTLIFLPSLQIITACGIERFYLFIKKFSFPTQIGIGFVGIALVLFSFLQYGHLYFFQMNHEFSRFWQFGFEHAVNYAQQHRGEYKKIRVSQKLEQPYIFFLFYTRYDPQKYAASGGTKEGNVQAFDIFEFRDIQWENEPHDGSTLYMLSPNEQHGNPLHTIRYFDSSEAIVITE